MDDEMTRMALRSWMYEEALPIWEEQRGEVGVESGEDLLIPAGLIATVVDFVADELIDNCDEMGESFTNGGMFGLNVIAELVNAVHSRVCEMTIPEEFDLE